MNRRQSQVTNIPLLALCLGMVLCLSLAGTTQADPSLPMAYQPLSNALRNMPGSDWTAVQQEGGIESKSQPTYKSNAVENVTFSGYFQATDATAQIALLSDDGADVYIDGQRVHQDYQNGHALEDLSKSLFPISYTFDPGHIYFIQIVYSNIYLTGPADIDGVTLFCYGGGGSLVSLSYTLQVRRSGATQPDPNNPVQTLPAAFAPTAIVAAGAQPNSAHQADVQITVTTPSGASPAGIYLSGMGSITAGGQGPNDPPNNVTALFSVGSGLVTDNNGHVVLPTAFTSGNRTEPTTIAFTDAQGGSGTATVSQVWNEVSDPWGYDDYFDYDTPSPITYTMAFNDSNNDTVPITGHHLGFIVTSLKGLEWSPAIDDYIPTPYQLITDSSGNVVVDQIADNGYSGLVTWGDVTQSDGVYSTTQLVPSDYNSTTKNGIDFITDSVGFDVVDNDAYNANAN